MRVLSLVFVVVLSGCTDDPCEPVSGKTSCGYCAQDVVTSSNPHAGMCRYCGGNVTCSGDICTDALRCNSRVFLSVPGATFHVGAPPKAASTSTTPAVMQVTPAGSHLSMGSTVRWSIHWDVTVAITAVLFEVTELGGYYELPVTTDQSNSGTVEVPVVETAEPPGASGCLGPMTCWAEAPAATTTGEASVSLVGAGGDVGQPMGGVGFTWDRPSYSQTIPSNTGGGGGTNACPTSAAQAGCCTTRGGIQVVGFGLAAPCTCPGDTCPGSSGYCGCPGCGGC